MTVPDSKDVVLAGDELDRAVLSIKQSGISDAAIALALATIASRECARAFGPSNVIGILIKAGGLASNLAVSRTIN
ncbi:MAG: hypothetical protein EKK47_13580 [Burkholderiales bacterium]|nr:MAG: hypothetical protein EKK47_13580 [Burkholderiales bacterium]